MKIWQVIQISGNLVIKEFTSHNQAKAFFKFADYSKKKFKIECKEVEQ